MRIVRNPRQMQAVVGRWRRRGGSIGFVPTMGALHRGHGALIARARRENDRVVVSVFVNPLQFGPQEDFRRYPRPFARDAALCRAAGADALYHPTAAAMYPTLTHPFPLALPSPTGRGPKGEGREMREGFTRVEVPELADILEGKSRPGHFTGVATVVLKLFAAVQPDRAYFGEKDFQQLQVVRRMAADLDLPLKIVGCPTVREPDGLALSSRNAYLSPEQRAVAPFLVRGLRAAAAAFRSGERNPRKARAAALAVIRRISGAKVDYVEISDPHTLRPSNRLSRGQRILAAVRLGTTRLIDNLAIG